MAAIEILILIGVIAFILEFFDASLGMGFGSITVILILLGFPPLEVIPAVLITSSILSLVAGASHHIFKNIDISHDGKELKIALVLASFGIIAIGIGTFVANQISILVLELYIGLLVIAVGLLVLFKEKRKSKFSWPRIIATGSVAAFNKGMSGGGYGPVLAGGQIISGVDSRKIAGITSFTEGIVSLFGAFIFIFFSQTGFNWPLVIALSAGGLLSTPAAAYFTSKVDSNKLRKMIGVGVILLGLLFLVKIFVF